MRHSKPLADPEAWKETDPVAVGARVSGGRESTIVSGGDGGAGGVGSSGFVSSTGGLGVEVVAVPGPDVTGAPDPADPDSGAFFFFEEGDPEEAWSPDASRAFLMQRCSAARFLFPLPA
jgi:hypothetical protein